MLDKLESIYGNEKNRKFQSREKAVLKEAENSDSCGADMVFQNLFFFHLRNFILRVERLRSRQPLHLLIL